MLKAFSYLLVMPLVLLFLGLAGLFYLYQGQQISNATLHTEVQNALQTVLGDDYAVAIGETGLTFTWSSFVSVTGRQIEITTVDNGAKIAHINKVAVGLDPVNLLRGTFKFDELKVSGGTIDLAKVTAKSRGAQGIEENLELLAHQVDQLGKPFSNEMIQRIRANNLVVSGACLGRKKPEESLLITDLVIEPGGNDGVTARMGVHTSLSDVSISAQWHARSQSSDDGFELTAGVGPINSLEYLSHSDPIMALTEENPGGFGLQTLFRADIRLHFDKELKPETQFAKVQAEGGELRIGRAQTARLGPLIANFRSDLEAGVLELEKADVTIGHLGFAASATLGLPEQSLIQNPLPLRLELGDFHSADPLWNSEAALSEIDASGSFLAVERRLSLDQLDIRDISGNLLQAQLISTFPQKVTPSLRGSAKGKKLPLAMVQNFWPFNLSPPVRNWIRTRPQGGVFSDFSVEFDIGEGRLRELQDGKGFTSAEFTLSSGFSQMQLPTFGQLSPLMDSAGRLAIRGSALDISKGSGTLRASSGKKAAARDISLRVENIFARPPRARLLGEVSAPFAVMAKLADAEPLNVAKRLAVEPGKLTGAANTRLDVTFDLVKNQSGEKVAWSADTKLSKAGSGAPFFGQTIENANVSISARPKLVTAKGTASINGIAAELEISEPINGGDASKRSHKFASTVTTKDLERAGVDVAPVLSGQLGVRLETGKDGKERYSVDLKNADLVLPWISWSKGRGIPAKASFILQQKDGVNTLNDFSVSGPTFKAAGRLSFSKLGLMSAALRNVVLVRGDTFDVDVQRSGKRYDINASGRSFDGRAILNLVIHGDGIEGESAETDVNLSATFGRLVGFNKQAMENAVVRYKTNHGRLSDLQVRGAIKGQLSSIDARLEGNRTTFRFDSRSAGEALALVDIYRNMQGGRLVSELARANDGPFKGEVRIREFVVAGEERLKSLVTAPPSDRRLRRASGKLQEIDVQKIRFNYLRADITKDENFLAVKEGRLRNQQIGLTFEGTIFDPNDQMNVRGTFMPLFSLSRLIGEIPLIGDILSDGKKSGLIGITYRLKGKSDNPQILVNPLSIIAPGIFRQIFQFQE